MSEMVLLSNEFELIAQAMLKNRGDLTKASREKCVPYNAMALRAIVKDNPSIRRRYHEMLADELQDNGLHIAERILQMVELQNQAMGGMIEDDEGNEIMMPADPKMVIELSKEISRLIAEGKQQPMSSKQVSSITSKEDAKELLERFLNS